MTLDIIYDRTIHNNIIKIRDQGFNADPFLLHETDDRYCQAIFCVPTSNNIFLNSNFYILLEKLATDVRGIAFFPSDKDSLTNKDRGTFHQTFMQQLSFNAYIEWSAEISEQHYIILCQILRPYLPFRINYRKLIAVPSGLILCGYPSVDVNDLRNQYRLKCQEFGLELHEPYIIDIIHSTLFRLVMPIKNVNEFLEDYQEYLNRDIDYGYIVVDHYWMGKGTWKINAHEIKPTHKIEP